MLIPDKMYEKPWTGRGRARLRVLSEPYETLARSASRAREAEMRVRLGDLWFARGAREPEIQARARRIDYAIEVAANRDIERALKRAATAP